MRLVLILLLVSVVSVAGCTSSTPKNETLTEADLEFQAYEALPKYAGFDSDVNQIRSLECSDFIDKQGVEAVSGQPLQEPQKIVAPVFSGDYLKYSDYFGRHVVIIICSYEYNETVDNSSYSQSFGFLITYYSAKDRFEDFDQNITGQDVEQLDIGRRAIIYTNGGGVIDANNEIRYHTIYNIISILRERSMLQIVSGMQKSSVITGSSEEIFVSDPQPISRTDLTALARKINDNLNEKINGI